MLKQRVQQDSTKSLKSGDSFTTETLRMLLASITTKEKDKRYKISKQKPDATQEFLAKESELTDDEVIEAMTSEIKKRKDAIVLYKQGKRPDLAEREQKEIDILKKYLPEQLSEEELKKIITESITATDVKEIKDMGKVMAELNPKIKGKADIGQVSQIVKKLLIAK